MIAYNPVVPCFICFLNLIDLPWSAALRRYGFGAARSPVSKEVETPEVSAEFQIDIPRAGHKYPLGLARQGRKINRKPSFFLIQGFIMTNI